MLDKPENIANSTFLLGIFSLLFIILPGVASIFIFAKELFINLDWVKLLLLSASITTPGALLNVIASLLLSGTSIKDDFSHVSLGIIMGGLSIYLVLGISYLKSMSLPWVIILVLIVNIILWFFMWRQRVKNKNK